MKRVLITGIQGFIGKALVEHFKSIGWNVVGLTRNPDTWTDKAVRTFRYRMEDAPPAEAFEGVDVVIHCAYVANSPSTPESSRINIEATQKLQDQARKSNARFVFLSTMSAHDDAKSEYGKHKLKIESLLDPKQDLILKLGLVVGDGGLFGRMSEALKAAKVVPLIDGGKQPIQIIYIRDLARAVEHMLATGQTGVVHLGTEKVISIRDLYGALIQYFQTKNLLVPIPFAVIYPIARLAEKIGITLPISSESLLGLKNLKSFDVKEDLPKLGLKPRELPEALADIRAQLAPTP